MIRRFLPVALLLSLAAPALLGQDRFVAPAAGAAVPHASLQYESNGRTLPFDLYHPAGTCVVPLLVFVNIGSAPYQTWPIYTGWAEKTASTGIAAVVYQATNDHAEGDFDALISTLKARAGELHVDPSRVVIYAASANVQLGLPLAMNSKRDYLRGALIFYGTADVPSLRTDLPVFFVRSGLDSSDFNQRIGTLLARAISENAPWVIENYGGGFHGFEVRNDNEVSREIIDRALSFAHSVSNPQVTAAYASLADDAAVGVAFARAEWPRAVEGYRKAVAAHPDAGEYHRRLGLSLMETGAYEESLKELEQAWQLGLRGTRDTVVPAARAAGFGGNATRALYWLNLALSTPFGPTYDVAAADAAFTPVRDDPAFKAYLTDWQQESIAMSLLQKGETVAAMKILRDPKNQRFAREDVLNRAGYALLQSGHAAEGTEVLRLNTTRHPGSANAWDSLSEALEKGDRFAESLQAAKRGLKLLDADKTIEPQTRAVLERAIRDRLDRLGKREVRERRSEAEAIWDTLV